MSKSEKARALKTCSTCQTDKKLSNFHRDSSSSDGRRNECAECYNTRRRKRASKARNTETPADLSRGTDKPVKSDAGAFTVRLREGALTREDGEFIAGLAESERVFLEKRSARSVSLAVARENLHLRQLKHFAAVYLRDKIKPTGYATIKPKGPIKRTVCLLLSDLHLGANLSEVDNPIPFEAVQEARRLEFITRETIDFKPQYREHSDLLLLLNGDLIDGLLLHDLRDGAPLAEQKVIFWRYFRVMLGLFAQTFPAVKVVCQVGNHGRDKVRHHGRATSSKWDSHEWSLYMGLAEMCSHLENVSFEIPFRAVSVVDLYGSKLLLTHGDTEIKLGDPDTCAARNAQILDRVNATRIYGETFDACAFGHFHKPRYQPRNPRVLWNGALLPPNGYARSSGYIGEPCGQWLWEATEGYPVGDLRFLEVGVSQDRDERLGGLITPFRFR